MCREDLNDNPGAKADYERAIAMDAEFAPAHFYYGALLQKAKEQKKACDEYGLAITLAGTQGIGPPAQKASKEIGCR